MRKNSKDFRIHFRTVIESALHNAGCKPRFFREDMEFSEFMAESIQFQTPRQLVLAFMVTYFSVYLHQGLRGALCYGVVLYLTEISGNNEADIQALKDLAAIEYKTEMELGHWIDAHFPGIS